MRHLRILWTVMKRTGANRVLTFFLAFFFIDAALIWVFEPTIHTYRDALWYCYAVVSTAGFGDLVVTKLIPKLLSILLTAISLLAIGIISGITVNFYTEIIERKRKETISAFLDKLEILPELSKEELEELSRKVKRFR